MIRVHQLYTNWAGLSARDVKLTYRLLKILQKEEGFLIDFDAFANTDFTLDYFKQVFKQDKYKELSANNDLFKAVAVLPEVRDNYLKPALKIILDDFLNENFWPNSISYSNETGFTHGFWTVDRQNPKHSEYFSNVYSFYYERYLRSIDSQPKCRAFVGNGQQLVLQHVQATKLKALLSSIKAIKDIIKSGQRIKDNAAYVYYNILRSDVINQFPEYKTELNSLKEGEFKQLAEESASADYYKKVSGRVKSIELKIIGLEKKIDQQQSGYLKKLEIVLSDKDLNDELEKLYAGIFALEMPAGYQAATDFEYVDGFSLYNEKQARQSFFTSFLMPAFLNRNLNSFIEQKAGESKFSIGLNNDFTKDSFYLLSNAYLFNRADNLEFRFNKYSHHPVGGHSMLLHPGSGNLFDEDSSVVYNLELFNPLLSKYSARLSETNYTFAGGDNSGQGNWTLLDWLQTIARKQQISGFHLGLNNIDEPVIRDYFGYSNRLFKQNAFNLTAAVALAQQVDRNFIKPEDFHYNMYNSRVMLNSNNLMALSGPVKFGEEIGSNLIKFKYTGGRAKTDITITAFAPVINELLISFYGIDRNTRQINRAGNPDLVQSFGTEPIIYQKINGVLTLNLGIWKKAVVAGLTPSGEKLIIDAGSFELSGGYLKIDTAKTDKRIVSYKIFLIN